MKERRDCSIVQDLLPNYVEKLTNDETNNFIEEHLKDCKGDCNNVLQSMQKDLEIEKTKTDGKAVNFLKKYNRKLSTFSTILCVIIIIAVIFGVIFFVRLGILVNLKNIGDSYFETNKNEYFVKSYRSQKGFGGSAEVSILNMYSKNDKYLQEVDMINENISGESEKSKIKTVYDGEKQITIIDNKDKKVAHISSKDGFAGNMIISTYLNMIDIIDFVKISAFGSIKQVKWNDYVCYMIEHERN